MFSVPKSSNFSRIVLASGSPRRRDILKKQGGIGDLVVIPSTFEEENKGLFDSSDVYSYISGIAAGKVKQVALSDKTKSAKSVFNKTLFIGSDSVILLDGKVLEKPVDRGDAVRMLKGIRDKIHHQVCTAVVLVVANENHTDSQEQFITHSFCETADVKFSSGISDDVIERYVDTGDPMDKAGGYGIQGIGAQLVESINGDYYAVMGFPLFRFCSELNKFIERLQTMSLFLDNDA